MIPMKAELRVLFVLSIFVLTGCAGAFKQNVDFNPDEPLRVAVLPFVQIDDKGEISNDEGRLILDNLALVSSKVEQTPPQIVRKQTLVELGKTKLDLISTALIDIDLPHRGFNTVDGKIDLKKLMAASPRELCGTFLGCDAVLYGTITEWDRSYYGIQSVNSVGISLKLVAAKDGKVLFSASGEDSESRGLTKGPTGFSSIVLEPIRGLDSEIIADLSRSVVQKLIAPLRADRRPAFLEEAPPAVYAAAHDGPIRQGRPLIVVMAASEHQSAAFSVGDGISQIPMIEREPGHYYGEYWPVSTDQFSNAAVTVSVTDKFGRSTSERIDGVAISYSATDR